MYDLSRRALFFTTAASACLGLASAAAAAEAPEEAARRLAAEVGGLTERFYRTAVARTPFADAAVGRYARELAADHGARVALLAGARRSDAQAGEWGAALQHVVAASGAPGAFDPFAGDAPFLLAAHVLESATADALRLGVGHGPELAAAAAEANYHAGLVRTALAATPAGRTVAPQAETVTAWFEGLRRAPASSGDPARRALRTLFLAAEPSSRGGFFPHGLPGPLRLSA